MKLNKKLRLSRKKTILYSSLATVFPIAVGLLLWSVRLPDQFAIYLDSDPLADGQGSMLPAILVLPLSMLVVQWIVLFVTYRDPCNQEQSHKVLSLSTWIIPLLSNLTSYMTFALAMGAQYPVLSYMQIVLGLLFALIGNYMPKTRPNATIGIRIPWVYTSRNNWNATHRFAGKCWMIGGLLMVLVAFLPTDFSEELMLMILLVLIVVPVGFSYVYYLRQKANGDPLHSLPKPGKGAIIALVILLIFLCVILFTGDLNYEFEEEYMTIEASFYNDYIVRYSDIQSMEYHLGNVEGNRIGGFGSLRLQMGYFNSEELDTYTRYTYTNPDACIILTLRGRTLVISGKTAAATNALYNTLKQKIG